MSRDASPSFRRPNLLERAFNRAFGVLIRLGLGLVHDYVLEVRGRKTGRLHGTPVSVLDLGGRRFLVAPRGRTQWVENAEVAGNVALVRGRSRQRYRARRRTPSARWPDGILSSSSTRRAGESKCREAPLPSASARANFAAWMTSRRPREDPSR